MSVPNRRNGKGDIQSPPIFGLPYGFEVVDLVSAPDVVVDDVFLRETLRGDYERDVTADGLGRRVAEHPLRSPIPRRDYPVEGLADDGIVRRINNRRKQGGYVVIFDLRRVHKPSSSREARLPV